jgi:hypothetical protein
MTSARHVGDVMTAQRIDEIIPDPTADYQSKNKVIVRVQLS